MEHLEEAGVIEYPVACSRCHSCPYWVTMIEKALKVFLMTL